MAHNGAQWRKITCAVIEFCLVKNPTTAHAPLVLLMAHPMAHAKVSLGVSRGKGNAQTMEQLHNL